MDKKQIVLEGLLKHLYMAIAANLASVKAVAEEHGIDLCDTVKAERRERKYPIEVSLAHQKMALQTTLLKELINDVRKNTEAVQENTREVKKLQGLLTNKKEVAV